MAQAPITIENLPDYLTTTCLECGLVKVMVESIELNGYHRTIYSHPCCICQEKRIRQEEKAAKEAMEKLWNETIPRIFRITLF